MGAVKESEQPAAFLWYVWIFLIYSSTNTDAQKSVINVDWTWKNRLLTKKLHLLKGSSVVVMMDGHVLHLLMMRIIKRSLSEELYHWLFVKFKFVSEWIQLLCCSIRYPSFSFVHFPLLLILISIENKCVITMQEWIRLLLWPNHPVQCVLGCVLWDEMGPSES